MAILITLHISREKYYLNVKLEHVWIQYNFNINIPIETISISHYF